MEPARTNRMSRRTRPVAYAVVAGLLLGGCVTETKQSGAPVTREQARPRQKPAPAGRGDSPIDVTDPCAMRLHDVSGVLLMYYAINRRLPAKLDELESLTDVDTGFSVECPASHQPYVYVPGGLSAPNQQRLLVLYDPVPAHAGLRWGVFIAPPREGKPPATFVLLMSEEVFRSFVR
jgi:hypothetical protein